MQEGLSGRVVSILTWFLVLAIIVVGAVSLYPKWIRCESLRRENAELQANIDRKKAEIARLRDYQVRFRSEPDFVEAIARQNHRVFPGEYVFILEKK